MEARYQKWFDAMKAKGHSPAIDKGGCLDSFFYDGDTHNGPGCTVCNWSCCWHCESADDIPECDCLEIKADSGGER